MFTVRMLIIGVMVVCSGCATLPNRFEEAPALHSKAVVFDIDGTLTPTPLRFWQARDEAATVVRHFAGEGYQIFYVTARVTVLQSQIPRWLKDNGFPKGDLFLTQSGDDRDDPARFKTRILRQLQQNGWQLEWAFGDSTTDFVAYRAAGIPKARIVALQRACDAQCEPGEWGHCAVGWDGVLGYWSIPLHKSD